MGLVIYNSRYENAARKHAIPFLQALQWRNHLSDCILHYIDTVSYLQRKFKVTLNYKYAKLSILRSEFEKEKERMYWELSESEKMDDQLLALKFDKVN